MRQSERVRAFPRADEVVAEVLASGESDDAFYITMPKPAGGNRLPAISFVTGTGPMVRSSSEGFNQWAFAIDRRRRALLGKMDMLKG